MNLSTKATYYTIQLILCLLLFSITTLKAQLNSEQQELIRQYTQKIKEYKAENQLKTASNYSNKCASLYLSAGYYQSAINSYLESAQMNQQIGNDADIKKIYNNIAMIYSEMNQFKNTLVYFEKSLLISRRNNNRKEIAVSLMDISTILVYNKQFDKAIEYLNESLKISNDLKDFKNQRTCYNLLSQCYKAAGDMKKYDEYLKIFMAYDKKIESGDTNIYDSEDFISAKTENIYSKKSEVKNSIESINRMVEKPVLPIKQINNMYDSISKALNESKSRTDHLSIDILDIDSQLIKSKLRISELNKEKSQIKIYAILISSLFLIVASVVFAFILRRKQNYIRKLEQKLSEKEK